MPMTCQQKKSIGMYVTFRLFEQIINFIALL